MYFACFIIAFSTSSRLLLSFSLFLFLFRSCMYVCTYVRMCYYNTAISSAVLLYQVLCIKLVVQLSYIYNIIIIACMYVTINHDNNIILPRIIYYTVAFTYHSR